MSPLFAQIWLAAPAVASPLALKLGAQPFDSVATLLYRLEPTCGSFAAIVSEDPEELWLSANGCEARWWPSRGQVSVQFSATDLVDADLSSLGRLAELEVATMDWLDLAGFDPAESRVLATHSIAMVSEADPDGPREVLIKTWVARAVDGVDVAGNRVVVTREPSGALRGLDAVWPSLDAARAIEDGVVAGVADGVVDELEDGGETVLGVESVLVVDSVADGRVLTGRKVEIIDLAAHPDEKGRSVTLFNGSPLEAQ